ncbi:MAG TPA: acyltransferase family protein [Candidatus Saccharimonadales bacterium]|nr:acyltransferase family protein [Candidatus Saccharimonadales bacterium]
MTTTPSATIGTGPGGSTNAQLTSPSVHRRSRDPAIDLTKGALVVLMFVYHSVNYFCVDKDPLRYLHFLPASFIFITGFLLITVQHPKLRRGVPRVRVHVLVHGLKLFAIFAGLNVVAHVLFTSNYNNPNFGVDTLLSTAPDILVVGGLGSAVFDVLLPISYLLILSGVLLVSSETGQRTLIALVTGLSILGCVMLTELGRPLYNLEMLSMGLLGMLAGLVPQRDIAGRAQWLVILLAANVVYAVLAGLRYPTYVVNILGVLLAVLALFAIGRNAPSTTLGYRWLTLLGRYSLIGYIAQIAVLQVLYRLARYLVVDPHNFTLALIVTAISTTLIVLVIDRSRTKFAKADATYRVLFA